MLPYVFVKKLKFEKYFVYRFDIVTLNELTKIDEDDFVAKI